MKARILETNKRHLKYLAAAAVIALAVAFMLTGGVTTAQGLPEVNFESINVLRCRARRRRGQDRF